MGEVFKVLLVDCSQEHGHCPLDDLILEYRHSDRSLSSVILGKPHAFDRWGFVASGSEPLMEGMEILIKVLGILLCRYPVYPRCSVLACAMKGFFEEVNVDQVRQGGKYPSR